MTKGQFIDEICEKIKADGGRTERREVAGWVNYILAELANAILDNTEVKLSGFGVFEQKIDKKATRSDFAGGIVPAENRPRIKFSAAEALKMACKEGMRSDEYIKWVDTTNLLRRGGHVKGWKLGNHRFAIRDE